MSLYWVHINYDDLLQSTIDPSPFMAADNNKSFNLISHDNRLLDGGSQTPFHYPSYTEDEMATQAYEDALFLE
jgi:hypothetical protein